MSEKGESRKPVNQVALSRDFFGVIQDWENIAQSPALHSETVLNSYEKEFAHLLSGFTDDIREFYWSKLPHRFKARVTKDGTIKNIPRSTIIK